MSLTLYQRLYKAIDDNGFSGNIDEMVEDIINITSNPSGKSKDDIEKLRIKDRSSSNSINFEKIYTLDDMIKMVDYGYKYALESQSLGFVPKGNILSEINLIKNNL